MVALLDPRPGESLLELAAGLGETGFLAAERIAPGGRLLSTDAAPEMIEAARRRAAELGVENVDFRVVDAASPDLPAGSVDGILMRFGLMLVPEPTAALAGIHRTLRPGGRAVLAVWAGPEHNEWMTAAGRAALELGLAERPDPDAPGPFRLADAERLRSLVEEASLAVEALEDVPLEWETASVDEWWELTRDLSQSLAGILASASADQAAALRARAGDLLAPHVRQNGSLRVPALTRVLLARRPEF